METFSVLLDICLVNSPFIGEFAAQRPATRSIDVFFDLCLNKRLSKQWWGWWFETSSRPLWCHCNGVVMLCLEKNAAISLVVSIEFLINLNNWIVYVRSTWRKTRSKLRCLIVTWISNIVFNLLIRNYNYSKSIYIYMYIYVIHSCRKTNGGGRPIFTPGILNRTIWQLIWRIAKIWK